MAQLKDLIVNGPSRFIGDVYATTFTGDLNGNANTATSATTAAALTGKTLVTASAVTTSNWSTYKDNHIPTMSFMAYWNGAYSGTSSNLTYCAQGTIIGSNNIGSQSVKYATTSGSCSGNAATTTKWATPRIITLTGSVTGSVSIDGSANVSLATTTNHTHTFASLTSKPTTLSGYGITDAPTKSGAGATGTWGISISGNAATATKIGTSTVGSTTMPVYINSGTPTAITSFPEAYLSWGGKNFSNSCGPIDAAMISDLGACRSMFAKAAGITVQYSRDGGSTWVDYGLTDTQKTGLFSVGHGIVIGGTTETGIDKSKYKLRVIVTTDLARIYTVLNKIAIYISTEGSTGSNVTIDARTKANVDANSDTWVTLADKVAINGWSGWNIINIPDTRTYNQYQQIRFTFGVTSHASTVAYPGLSVSRIMMFGGVGWVVPSNMASNGHLYTFNASQNATFPGAVTSTMFKKSGGTSSQFLKADGSVDSNTYSKSNHTHTSVLDVNGSSAITFAYSKAGLGYGDYTWLAGWNGHELRAIDKAQFARASHTHTKSQITDFAHTHTKSQITDFPSSLPASDVYAWAKASTKPTYNATEVKLSNYSKDSSYSAISASDTMQKAIGKLEGAISGLETLLASI